MGATQYYLAQTLDGYIAEVDGGLEWLMGYEGDAARDAGGEGEGPMVAGGAYERFFADVGALAMGSATYEFVLAHSSGGWPYEGTPTWVFTSRSLPAPDGADVRFASGPVGPTHEQMAMAARGANVWLVGGGDLAMQFVDADLLDEVHVTIVPVVLGAGIPAFSRRVPRQLRLAGTRAFENGMVELLYEVSR